MSVSSSVRRLVSGLCLLAAAPASLTAAPVPPEERTIHGQPSWILDTNDVELAVTKRGGHMAPVTFDRKEASPIRPYHVSPWQDEGLEKFPAEVREGLTSHGRSHPGLLPLANLSLRVSRLLPAVSSESDVAATPKGTPAETPPPPAP